MRSPSPIRVAFRSLVAGSTTFMEFGKGTDPSKVFRMLVDEALHESGHGGYTGTIAEKGDFRLQSRTPMSRAEAYKFADKDMDNSDKHGPAHAVPVAETKVKSEKEVTLKIKAKSQREAQEAAEAEFRSKVKPEAKVEISVTKVAKIKEGGLPTLSVVPPTGTKVYEVVTENWQSIAGSWPSKNEAVTALKTKILRDEYFSGNLKPGQKFALVEKKPLKTITVTEAATKLPVWEVTAKVRVVEVGAIEGYLFYGWASM